LSWLGLALEDAEWETSAEVFCPLPLAGFSAFLPFSPQYLLSSWYFTVRMRWKPWAALEVQRLLQVVLRDRDTAGLAAELGVQAEENTFLIC